MVVSTFRASFLLGLICLAGCGTAQPTPPAPQPTPVAKEIQFRGGTEWLYTCGDRLAAVSRERSGLGESTEGMRVFLWDWNDLDKAPIKSSAECYGLAMAFIAPDRTVSMFMKPYGSDEPSDQTHPILVNDVATGSLIKRLELGPEWFCDEIRTAVNGKLAVIQAMPEPAYSGKPSDVRVGIIGTDLKEIAWAPVIQDKRGTLCMTKSVPSEDGQWVATVGTNNGSWVCMVRVGGNQVAWEFVDSMSVGFKDAAFSPDSKTVYAGGGSGVLYAFDVATGKVKSQWPIGEGGKVQYGQRINRVAASPDGSLVAAGTGPDGEVYLWDTQTGSRVDVIRTRQSTIWGLAFSPDSKRIAATGVENKTIEIFDVVRR